VVSSRWLDESEAVLVQADRVLRGRRRGERDVNGHALQLTLGRVAAVGRVLAAMNLREAQYGGLEVRRGGNPEGGDALLVRGWRPRLAALSARARRIRRALRRALNLDRPRGPAADPYRNRTPEKIDPAETETWLRDYAARVDHVDRACNAATGAIGTARTTPLRDAYAQLAPFQREARSLFTRVGRGAVAVPPALAEKVARVRAFAKRVGDRLRALWRGAKYGARALMQDAPAFIQAARAVFEKYQGGPLPPGVAHMVKRRAQKFARMVRSARARAFHAEASGLPERRGYGGPGWHVDLDALPEISADLQAVSRTTRRRLRGNQRAGRPVAGGPIAGNETDLRREMAEIDDKGWEHATELRRRLGNGDEMRAVGTPADRRRWRAELDRLIDRTPALLEQRLAGRREQARLRGGRALREFNRYTAPAARKRAQDDLRKRAVRALADRAAEHVLDPEAADAWEANVRAPAG